MSRESAHELFERINGIKDKNDRIQALANARVQGRLAEALYYGLSPNVKFVLPPGNPPYRDNEDTMMSHGNFWSEIRRMYLFVEGGKALADDRRQSLFIQMLEFVHPKDAEIILAIKDRKWPYRKITEEIVEIVFPGLLSQKVDANGARY